MSKKIEGIAIVHFDKAGWPDYLVCGDERFRLFVVDERAPNDRVYEITGRRDASEIKEIMGDDPIGHCKDDRHAAIEARILEAVDGKPRLRVVDPEPR